ncbi:hypothetical protein JMUB7504_27590 [Staphylococcus aureus]
MVGFGIKLDSREVCRVVDKYLEQAREVYQKLDGRSIEGM